MHLYHVFNREIIQIRSSFDSALTLLNGLSGLIDVCALKSHIQKISGIATDLMG